MDIKNNKEEEIKTEVEEDETELDKVLEESIESVKAGNELTPIKEEAKTEETKEETPEVPKSEDDSNPPVDEVKPEEVKPEEVKPEGVESEKYEFRVPNKVSSNRTSRLKSESSSST